MNNLIIAALTFIMLPAIADQASAKNTKNCREMKNSIVVEKSFTGDIVNSTPNVEEMTSVNVDYIIEDGKAFITYIDAENEKSKYEVVKFIESASYNFDIVPGKIYSMKLTLKK